MSFASDVQAGKTGELLVLGLFANAGIECVPNTSKLTSKLSHWDLRFSFNDKERYIEVKHDLYEKKSGNVAVEYRNPRLDKPSGITATRSDIWVFVLSDESVWACRTSDLKRHLKQYKGVRDIEFGGDGNASMRLYRRIELFDQRFFRLDELSKKEFLATIEVLLES